MVLDWNHEAGVWEAVDGQVIDEASGTVSVEVSDLSHKAVAWLLTVVKKVDFSNRTSVSLS